MASTERAWETVLHHIETRLLLGELGPGDRLPAERQLATDLGVGRSSVREALRVLEVLGLVRTGTGSGPTSGAVIIATPQGGMSALIRLQVAAHGFPVADVVRTRVILETAVGEELAAGTPALSAAETLLTAMDQDDLDPAEFLALDQQFHQSLAEATGNEVVTATMAGLRSSIEGYVVAGVESLKDWPATQTRLRREHREILSAIEAGDAAAARACIHEHITGYYAETQLDADDHVSAASTSVVSTTEGE